MRKYLALAIAALGFAVSQIPASSSAEARAVCTPARYINGHLVPGRCFLAPMGNYVWRERAPLVMPRGYPGPNVRPYHPSNNYPFLGGPRHMVCGVTHRC